MKDIKTTDWNDKEIPIDVGKEKFGSTTFADDDSTLFLYPFYPWTVTVKMTLSLLPCSVCSGNKCPSNSSNSRRGNSEHPWQQAIEISLKGPSAVWISFPYEVLQMSTFLPLFHTIKTATFVIVRKSLDQQVTNAHSLNLNLNDLCVFSRMLSSKIYKKMQWFPTLTTEISPLICKSITQVRGNESVPLEDMESNVRLAWWSIQSVALFGFRWRWIMREIFCILRFKNRKRLIIL